MVCVSPHGCSCRNVPSLQGEVCDCSISSSESCIRGLQIANYVANRSLGCAVPPGDEGWLCPVCECKMECIEVINAYLGTNFEVENSWEVSAMLIALYVI